MPIPGMLTPKKLSQNIGVAKMTLAIWRCRGYGPPFLKLGNRVYYIEEDVSKWLNAQRRTPRRAKGRAA